MIDFFRYCGDLRAVDGEHFERAWRGRVVLRRWKKLTQRKPGVKGMKEKKVDHLRAIHMNKIGAPRPPVEMPEVRPTYASPGDYDPVLQWHCRMGNTGVTAGGFRRGPGRIV